MKKEALLLHGLTNRDYLIAGDWPGQLTWSRCLESPETIHVGNTNEAPFLPNKNIRFGLKMDQ